MGSLNLLGALENIKNKPLRQGLEWLVLGAKTLYDDMVRCDLFKHASAMAYVTLLSIVPSLAAVFSLMSVFSPLVGENSQILIKLKELILTNLAAGTGEQAIGHIESFLQNLNITQIGLSGLTGILISLVLLARQIELALNRVWLVKKERNIFRRSAYIWNIITLGTLIAAIVIATLTGFNLEQWLPFGGEAPKIDKTLTQQILPKLATLAFFTMLYKIVPNTFVALKHAVIGAVPAAILFFIASSSYGNFTTKFTNYEAIYGALAAIPLFLMWLYILWLITLLGAVLAWRAQQGFNFTKEVNAEKKMTPVERYRNHQMQNISPLVSLTMIYRKFSEGRGQGCSASEIAHEVGLPKAWILESLELLEERKYVVRAQNQGEKDDSLLATYFPTIPPAKLNLQTFANGLTLASSDWLEEWGGQDDSELGKLVSALAELGKPNLPDKDFKRFIVELSHV